MQPAPFHAAVAEHDAQAFWLEASDGVRLRLAIWPQEGASGTVLLFPGRTEYVEKYGRAAQDFAQRGFAMAAIDWRGQGLADRLREPRELGYVGRFGDFQHDVAAMVKGARALGLPEPFYLVAHSMGGAIGLRALCQGLPVKAAVFSAPMWGILIAPAVRPGAVVSSWLASKLGFHGAFAPGTGKLTYLLEAEFAGNTLTTDEDMWNYMYRQASAHPELTLGGPSLHWLHEALKECRTLLHITPPDVPSLAFLGSNEQIVDPDDVKARAASWPSCTLEMIEGAEHEVLMETPATRTRIFDAAAAFFSAHSA